MTEASTALFDLIKSNNLIVYPDRELRRSVSQAVARETTRGWRIAKENRGHKIDVVVALAQAAYTAMRDVGPTTRIGHLVEGMPVFGGSSLGVPWW